MWWTPVIVCSAWIVCSGAPIEGTHQPSEKLCKMVAQLAIDLADEPDWFKRRYITYRCEKRDE